MNFRQSGLFYILILLTLSMAWVSHASPEIIVPRLSETPVVDSHINEAAWMSAVELPIEPQEHCQMRVGFDEAALWFALQSVELRQGTLEIVLRVTDCVEEQDRFIVDTHGNKQLIHQRIGDTSLADMWQAVAQQDGNTWSVEMRIPFETLGIQPVSGNVFAASAIFHESSPKVQPDIQFSRLYLETRNLLASSDLSDRSRWGFTEGDEALYTKTSDGVSIQTPGRYSTMQRSDTARRVVTARLLSAGGGGEGKYLNLRACSYLKKAGRKI